MKPAVYSRRSAARPIESSVVDQVRACAECAARQGWQVLEYCEDQGISGAALANRHGALRRQGSAFARRVDAVLVTDVSPLSCSQHGLSKMIDWLVAKAIRVVGVQDGYDSARRGHKLQASLSGNLGEALPEAVRECRYAPLESPARERRATAGAPADIATARWTRASRNLLANANEYTEL
jgi:DNA invertase Pin-like site-specific DNA recombinase